MLSPLNQNQPHSEILRFLPLAPLSGEGQYNTDQKIRCQIVHSTKASKSHTYPIDIFLYLSRCYLDENMLDTGENKY